MKTVTKYRDSIIHAETSGARAYHFDRFLQEQRNNPGMPVYAPANVERENWFIPAEAPGTTVPVTHLITNNQTYGQQQFRTICNRTFDVDALIFVNPDQSLMCEQCVTIENIWAENSEN